MMELLERYLLQIGRYLPRKDREDTINELRSLILENYDQEFHEGDNESDVIYKVIKAFGSPKDVATQYRSDQPLVSRELEPLMFLIMKINAITLPLTLVIIKIVEYITQAENPTIMNLLLDVTYAIPDILNALLIAFGMIFIIFILINRSFKPNVVYKQIEFDPKLLPAIPKKVYNVTLIETIIGIFGSVVFLYLFNFQPGLIAVYFDGTRLPLLNSNFERILPFININVFISLTIYIIHLIKRRRIYVTALMEFISGIFGGIIMLLLATGDIFNEIIIDGYDLSIIPQLFKIGMTIGAFAAFIGTTVKFVKVNFAQKDQ